LVGGPPVWQVRGVEPVGLPAVGVFLDDGGSKDEFDLSRRPPPLPDNDRVRLVRVGAEGGADVHCWVDR
jgi:hypothetical protein